MDQYGDKIRQLTTNGPLRFDKETSNAIAAYQTQCYARNLRGECANPNILDEDGQFMSWEKYDLLKARGVDPRTASRAHTGARNADRRFGPVGNGFAGTRQGTLSFQ